MPQQKAKIITLHYPSETVPISLSGNKCSLSCKHCSSQYLKHMKDPALYGDNKGGSFLISGGCNQEGDVETWKYIPFLKKLKDTGAKLNIHTGLIPKDKVTDTTPYASVISFDFLADEDTIKEVYGLKADPKQYKDTFLMLSQYKEVVPHITVGLKGGKISGEYKALETLAELGCKRIVFLVMIPTKNTPYENLSPPDLGDTASLFKTAAELMPNSSFGLGCMHPRGSYKEKLEMTAFKYGFDSFVNPSKKFRLFLEDLANQNPAKYQIVTKKECCVF